MTSPHQFDDINNFIADIKSSLSAQDVTHQNYFEIFANEACFGLSIIKTDLNNLPPGAKIMEIGAGLLILSGYLAYKGFQVYALEPIGEGFSVFRTLQSAVLTHYKKKNVHLNMLESRIEDIYDTERFDYVFSINVFEHISNIELGLVNAYLSLHVGGILRIYCPNYIFPYEPHFKIPTVISKQFTEFLFRSLIYKSAIIPEAKELWDGLNWINIFRVRKLFSRHFNNEPIFNQKATYQIVRRIFEDPHFRERHSIWIIKIFRMIDRCGLIQLFMFVPVTISFVMDFKIRRELFGTVKE